ncbi:anti-sigma-E factor RseA [Apirhabdus apintestini]|nr:anti-sigma-E factor RseA [Enterobacteriaceae bacterium CA-0114]
MQKETLSALMDGESLDHQLIEALSKDEALRQSWEHYHLIRDTLRGEVNNDVLQIDVSSRVMAAIAGEPARQTVSMHQESQPAPHQWQKMPFWKKLRPWTAQITQIGVAACVSLAVIVGVQHYNGGSADGDSAQPESPVFNTLPMMGKASPVSLGVPSADSAPSGNSGQQQVHEQRRRINAMLQDYELQRRLHAEQIQFGQARSQQAALQVPGNQTLGNQSQ